VRLAATRPGAPDEHGTPRLEIVPGTETELPADRVIIAFGFRPDPADWFGATGIETGPRGQVITTGEDAEFPFQTANPGIFAGGDMVRGSSLVVHAVHEGRMAAQGMLAWLEARQAAHSRSAAR
jgi:glutamate synthase (NADPH/NADH) small chain